MNIRALWPLCLAAVLLLSLFLRLSYLFFLGDFISADEAVGGLMALHIAQGKEFPLLLWEAHYGGTLISYLGALLFLFIEPSPFTFRLAALPLDLVGIGLLSAAAHSLWGIGPAAAAALWLAAGPPLLFAMSSQAIGGYVEVLAFGGLGLWLAVRLAQRAPRVSGTAWDWTLLGAVGGLGTYSLAFVLPLFAGALWALRREREGLTPRESVGLAAGFLVGFSPILLYNIVHGGASALRLAGRVLDVSRAELGGTSSVSLLFIHKGIAYSLRLLKFPSSVVGNLPVFLGLSPWAAAGVIALFAGGILVACRRSASAREVASTRPEGKFGLALIGWCTLATLLFVWVLGLDAPRHLFPFYLLVPLALAALWQRLARGWRVVGWGGLALLLLSNVAGTVHDAREAGPRVAGLMKALDSRDIRFVYTDYWIAYPLIFLSREMLLASPLAGPVNVERRPAYTQAVEGSPRPAYVFRLDAEASAVFVREMRRHGNPFIQEQIGEFDLYVPARHVRPDELALLRQF